MKKSLRKVAVPAPERTAQAGFTLLEVMAAVAILGVALVTVIQLFSGGLGLVKSSTDYTRMVLLAGEKMTEALSSGDLGEGTSSGVTKDGLSWAVEVNPYGLKEVAGAANVYMVVVSTGAQGPGKKRYALTTLKAVF